MVEQHYTSLRPPCSMPSIGWSGVKLAAIGRWSSGNAFSGVMNHASSSGSLADESAQSPDLNPIEHLWDELEHRLRTRPNHTTSVADLTNALVAEWKQVPAAMFQHLLESLPRRGCYSCKGGTNSILMPMNLEWDVQRAGVHILLVM